LGNKARVELPRNGRTGSVVAGKLVFALHVFHVLFSRASSFFLDFEQMLKGEQLWRACSSGNLASVRSHLSENHAANVNWAGDVREDTPLHRCSRLGHAEIVKELLLQPRVEVNRGNRGDATPFYLACQEGHLAVVRVLLSDREVDPNKATLRGSTPLGIACERGHHEIVSLLLANPKVDPDRPIKDNGATPLIVACDKGHLETVSLLLTNPRVNPNRTTKEGCTPLWCASQGGHIAVVRRLLASRNDIDPSVRSTLNNRTAAEQALANAWPRHPTEWDAGAESSHTLCADLIAEYVILPIEVRAELQRDLGFRDHFIGHTFALVVFFTDEFLRLGMGAPEATTRFYHICSQVPLELQMTLCNRMFGSAKDLIMSRDSEPAFKWLARASTWSL